MIYKLEAYVPVTHLEQVKKALLMPVPAGLATMTAAAGKSRAKASSVRAKEVVHLSEIRMKRSRFLSTRSNLF